MRSMIDNDVYVRRSHVYKDLPIPYGNPQNSEPRGRSLQSKQKQIHIDRLISPKAQICDKVLHIGTKTGRLIRLTQTDGRDS